MIIRPMKIEDYDEIFAMWQITTKRALSKADERSQIERYLIRNEGMSQVAVVDGKIVGTVLAGHDGRRGFIQRRLSALPPTESTKPTYSATKTTKRDRISGRISALKSATMFSFSHTITKEDRNEYKRKRFKIYNAYLWQV